MNRKSFHFSFVGPASRGRMEVAAVGADAKLPKLERQRPTMYLRDELTLLLHAAAEVEHSLMVQYLYAAFSLEPGSWRNTFMQVAKEEMGHLMSIQNILLLLGSPLNLEREDYPYNELYPYPFKLERLSLHSAARYVLAEMPAKEVIPAELKFDINQVTADSQYKGTVQRVGLLYAQMESLARQLEHFDIFAGGEARQGSPEEWKAAFNNLILAKVSNPAGIADLLDKVGEQGEGLTQPDATKESHFERLYKVYQEIRQKLEADHSARISKPVPEDPTVRFEGVPGYLSDPAANAWGDIFNHRYRWLLACVRHALLLESGPHRMVVKNWCFLEMTNLVKIADHLATLPCDAGGDPRNKAAAGPFELPYTLTLPDTSPAIWRHHLLMASHSLNQIGRLTAPNTVSARLKLMDEQRIIDINTILNAP